MPDWLQFNIHDLAGIRVARDAPTASLFADMLGPFMTERLEHADLTISNEAGPLRGGSLGEAHGDTEFRYTADGLHLLAADAQVLRDGEGFRLYGTGELLVTALPLIDRILVQKGAAMIHALTVSFRGHGLCAPAAGGTGKTSTMAKLVRTPGFSFMGDDWAFLSSSGSLLSYLKPMFIKPYHRSIYPHLFSARHKPLVPVSLSKRIARLTTRVHPLITRYPRVAQLTRRWSPEHMMVTPRRAFPEASFCQRAPLAAAVFIERFESSTSEVVLEEKSRKWMVSQLIGNFFAEMPRQSRAVMAAMGAAGLLPIEDAFAQKAAILDRALQGKPAYLLRVPQAIPPDEASDLMVGYISKVLAFAGIG